MAGAGKLQQLLAEISRCRICEADLPLGPRLLIVGQAPGTKVHASGIPWDDPSGDRLRNWLETDKETFYNRNKIAIIPMGFCYPGRLPKGGDRPPRPECAPTWHPALLALLPNIELTVLAGAYAQKQFLGPARGKNLTETVRAWRDHAPACMPLPHPSWRTVGWQTRNPWFDQDVLPELRRRVRDLL
jgi:uracil-DNA glycosylase